MDNNDAYSEFRKAAKLQAPLSEHLECPWYSFYDPLWMAVKKFIDLFEHTGKSVNSSTDNIVYEGYLFYKNESSKIDSYVLNKEFEAREQQRKESEAKGRHNNKT